MKGRGRKARAPRRRQRKQQRRVATRNREFAAMRQTLQLSNDQANVIYDLNVNMSQFDRAVQLARVYQYYRIKLIEYKFKPDSDTFIPGGNTSATLNGSIPYLYWLINKSDVLQISDFNAMRDSGAKPIRLDDKTITVRWKPNVLLGVNDAPSGTGAFAYNNGRQSPWLATNGAAGKGVGAWTPSTIPHFGLLYGVEQTTVKEDTILGYGVELTVHFEFMKPMQFKGATVDALPAVKKEVVPREVPVSKPLPLEV